MKNMVSSRQAGMLAGFMIFANKILLLPSLIHQRIGGDGWLLLIMLLALDFLTLLVFFALKKKYKTESFFQILTMKLGRVIAIIIFTTIIFYYLMKVILTFSATYAYFESQVYQGSSKFLSLFGIFAVVNFLLYKGLRPFMRTVEFFFFPVLFALVLCQLVSISNFTKTLILFDSNATSFFISAFKYCFMFGDFIFLFLIMHKIDMSKGGEKTILAYCVSLMAVIMAGYFLYFSIYTNTASLHTHAVSDIVALSYELFNVGRLDIVAVVMVMFLTYFQVSIFAYCFVDGLGECLPFLNRLYCIVVFNVVFLFAYLLFFDSLDFLVSFTGSVMPYVAIFVQYVLPIILSFFLISHKGRREHAKNT